MICENCNEPIKKWAVVELAYSDNTKKKACLCAGCVKELKEDFGDGTE